MVHTLITCCSISNESKLHSRYSISMLVGGLYKVTTYVLLEYVFFVARIYYIFFALSEDGLIDG